MGGSDAGGTYGRLRCLRRNFLRELAISVRRIVETRLRRIVIGFSAKVKLKRSDFGMSTYVPYIGDEDHVPHDEAL